MSDIEMLETAEATEATEASTKAKKPTIPTVLPGASVRCTNTEDGLQFKAIINGELRLIGVAKDETEGFETVDDGEGGETEKPVVTTVWYADFVEAEEGLPELPTNNSRQGLYTLLADIISNDATGKKVVEDRQKISDMLNGNNVPSVGRVLGWYAAANAEGIDPSVKVDGHIAYWQDRAEKAAAKASADDSDADESGEEE